VIILNEVKIKAQLFIATTAVDFTKKASMIAMAFRGE
jgi:hypothetical protein